MLRSVVLPVAYVGRQAVLDRQRRTVAYELLFRNSDENRARFADADQATATTMLSAAVELGLSTLAGDRPVYVNLPERFLLGEYPIPLPPERTVIEVLEDVAVTPELLAGLGRLKRTGFRIALDDFELTEATRALLPFADLIKLDVLGVALPEVERRYHALRPVGVPLLAEKVSTPDEHAAFHALGFDLFQGHFYELPVIAKARRLPVDRARLVQLLAKLYDPDASLLSVEALVTADVALSVRLLKLGGSALLSRGATIGSVGQAIARLGTQTVAAMVTLILMAGYDDKPFELARQVLVRARMCELLARDAGLAPAEMFTAGLLSLIDGILDQPLAEIVRDLPITPTIHQALLGDRAAMPARLVEAARLQDRGELDALPATGVSSHRAFVA